MNKKKRPLYLYYLSIMIVILLLNRFLSDLLLSRQEEVTYNEFQTALIGKKIDEVQVENEVITYTLKQDEKHKQYVTGNMQDPNLTEQLNEAEVKYSRIYPQEINPFVSLLVTFLLPVLIFWVKTVLPVM